MKMSSISAPIKLNKPLKDTMIVSWWAFSKAYLDKKCAVLTPWQLAQLFSDPQFCTEVVSCVTTWLWETWVPPTVAAEICTYLWWLSATGSLTLSTPIVTWTCATATVWSILWLTTVATSVDVNNDLIVTVNWVASTPLDLSTIVDVEETLTTLVWSEPNATDWWLLYTDEDGTWNFIKMSHTAIIGHTANTPFTITHWLSSTRIQVVAYDVTSWEEVKVEVLNRTTNTVDIISTTSDNLEIIIRK